jgi:hypothetical protein
MGDRWVAPRHLEREISYSLGFESAIDETGDLHSIYQFALRRSMSRHCRHCYHKGLIQDSKL